METGSPRAVFISYARDDIAAAQRTAEALRSNGVEVWFDLNELRGGDAWDQKIRKQIKACTLFLPIISARTQERSEGYFRLEWKLAVERTHLMAEGVPFLVPLVVDETSDSGAVVPHEFLRVQWMRLQGGLPSQQFVEHVKSLLAEPSKPSIVAKHPAPSSLPDEKSIAVLAFANLSRDPENEFFSDGISEELLNLVARIPGLNVAARTSAFYFKGKNVPIAEIARTLRVAHVVEGSVRKAGTKVRITAQLINASNGFQIWSETFDRELQDIFAVQDEIAGLIAKSLQLKLGGAVRVAQTVNPEAHRLVLEGRHFWNLRTRDGFDKAERAFAKALEIDSDFAPAHAGLADVWGVRAWYASASGLSSYKENLMKASFEAELALKLDPSLGEANAALGVVYYHLHRWAESERHFVQAFRLNPNYAIAHQWHAHLFAAQGKLDKGLLELERSLALDPLAFSSLIIYASQLNFAKQFQEALTITDRALTLRNEVYPPLQSARAFALLGLGRTQEAAAEARLALNDGPGDTSWWAGEEAIYVLHRSGSPEEVDKYLSAWKTDGGRQTGPMLQAVGRFEEALPILDQIPPTIYARLIYAPYYDEVRDDLRFQHLVRKLGFESEYLQGRATLDRMLGDRVAEG